MEETAQEYSADEFRAAVLEGEPQTAVFDCDGTLWALDSGYGFMVWSVQQGMLSAGRQAWLADRYRLYEAGEVDEVTICGEMVQVYAGIAEVTLREAARTYVSKHVAPSVFAEMALLVRGLEELGATLWAVSSTNRWVVEAAVWDEGRSPFAIPPERILAAEVAIEAGVATDRLLSVPSDEAKAEALIRAGLPRPDMVFGNSIHDAAMLAIAGRAFPVNANQALSALAGQKHWRVFRPALKG